MTRLRDLASVRRIRSSRCRLAAQTGDDFVPVTDRMLERAGSGDWLMWRRTQNGWAL